MNVGKVTLHITDDMKPIQGFVNITGIVVMGSDGKPLIGTPLKMRVKDGDRIAIDFVRTTEEEEQKTSK